MNGENYFLDTNIVVPFLEQCIIYPTDEEVALNYGEIKAILSKQGTPIPENDIWIAATSKTYNFPVVTRDKHFEKVPGLQIINW